jgi:ABC-type glycerol-3-phosphate transport system substrate-binding protein
MKKMFFFLAAILTLTACGGSNEVEAPASDSTVVVDSVNVVTDSAQLEDAAGASESAHEIPVK